MESCGLHCLGALGAHDTPTHMSLLTAIGQSRTTNEANEPFDHSISAVQNHHLETETSARDRHFFRWPLVAGGPSIRAISELILLTTTALPDRGAGS